MTDYGICNCEAAVHFSAEELLEMALPVSRERWVRLYAGKGHPYLSVPATACTSPYVGNVCETCCHFGCMPAEEPEPTILDSWPDLNETDPSAS